MKFNVLRDSCSHEFPPFRKSAKDGAPATILVWPPHPIGDWTYDGIEGSAYQRVFDHFVDSGEMADTVSCMNNGARYDSTWIPAKGSWVSNHGMSIPDHVVKNAQYTAQGYKETSVYTCGTVMAAIWRKP